MQPLAIPQITNPTDAGEPSNVGSAHSNRTSDVGFNDLMTAARASAEKRRAEQEDYAAKRAAEQAKMQSEAKEAEKTIDALSAAAKFASRNVKLKHRAAEEERLSAEHKREKAKTSGSQQAAALLDPEVNATAATSRAETANEEISSDPLTVNPQIEAKRAIDDADRESEQRTSAALIESGTAATEAKAVITQDIKPGSQVNSSQTETDADNLSELTAQPVSSDTKNRNELTLTSDQNEIASSTDGVKSMPNAAFVAALNHKDKEIMSAVVKAGDDATMGGSLSQAPSLQNADFENDVTATDADDKLASTTEPTSTVSTSQPIEANNITGAAATATTTNQANTEIENDQVLTSGRPHSPDQAYYQNRRDSASQSPNARNGEFANTTPASRINPNQQVSPDSSTSEAENFRAIRLSATSKTSSDQASDASKDHFDEKAANHDNDGSQQQAGEKRPTVVPQLKNLTETVSSIRNIGTGKDTVNIQDLTKLQVTEATVSSNPGSLARSEAQEQTVAPPTLATISSPSMAQTSETGTSNSASNLERRTIAADIRLRALERMVVAAARAGTESITLQLYPPGLGQVMIRLVMDGQKLRIVTRAANAEAVDALKEMEGDLRNALAVDGLDLAAFDVTDEKQDGEDDRRQKPAGSATRSSGPNNESFTVDLNA